MKPAPFDYVVPETLEEAVAILRELGEDAKVLAGGQSLVPTMNMRLARPATIVDINRLPGLGEMRSHNGSIEIGALVRQADAEREARITEAIPLLALALPHVGHRQTRNRGTICGSLAHADPSAEVPLVAVALGAQIETQSPRGARRIPAGEFFDSFFTTALAADELVTGASFPARSKGYGYAFEEFALRHGDFAIVATACSVRIAAGGEVEELSIVLGGVGERPHRCESDAWLGRSLGGDDIEDLAITLCARIEPPSDLRATAAYRRWLAQGQIRRTLSRALEDAR
ncbi:MAG TPA: xanthine dehydrogenase family protein subunit M [Candidatus Acidoferrales bacterium]|nr:xanthine dehydrogenase family protein subunit M [Candidatus Acidoferrales bacterium]